MILPTKNARTQPVERYINLKRALAKILPRTLWLLIFATIVFTAYTLYRNAQSKKPTVYGTTFDPWYATSLGLDWRQTYIEILDDLQVRYLRLSAFWDQIEPERDQYYWKDFDWMLTEACQRNVKVIMAVGRKLPRWPECHDPPWVTELKDVNLKQEQLKMIREAVEHFKQFECIEVWQVENEAFFPFGICPLADPRFVKKEIDLVRSLDRRPIITSDSGEAGNWKMGAELADGLAISMYRKVWLDWSGYIVWPVPAWHYQLKAAFLGIPREKIWNTELQCEPWTPGPVNLQSDKELAKTMTPEKFAKIIAYSQRAGLDRTYFWGVEWWAWEKARGNDWYWEYVKQFYQ